MSLWQKTTSCLLLALVCSSCSLTKNAFKAAFWPDAPVEKEGNLRQQWFGEKTGSCSPSNTKDETVGEILNKDEDLNSIKADTDFNIQAKQEEKKSPKTLCQALNQTNSDSNTLSASSTNNNQSNTSTKAYRRW